MDKVYLVINYDWVMAVYRSKENAENRKVMEDASNKRVYNNHYPKALIGNVYESRIYVEEMKIED